MGTKVICSRNSSGAYLITRRNLIVILTFLSLLVLANINGVIPTAHADPSTGTVCLSSNGTTCASTLSAAIGTTTIYVLIQGSDPLTAFDVQISADSSVLSATSISLSGSVLGSSPNIVLECINGALVTGSPCTSTDVLGVVHLAAAEIGPSVTGAGLLFSINYNVLAATQGVSVSFISATITNGLSTNSETFQNATFANSSPNLQVTDSAFCASFRNNVNLTFITDPSSPTVFKLVASNPGQLYENVFYTAAPGSPVSLNIQIPYPFVTQGSFPIQVSSSFSLNGGCFVPSFDVTSNFTISAGGSLTSSGHPSVVLSDYSPQNFGSTVTVTVIGTVPATGLVHVTIHLDYGLKGTTGWTKGVAQGSSNQTANSGLGLTLNNGQTYPFTVSGSESLTDTVTSSNVFKKDPGFAGVVIDLNENPVGGATVKIYGSTGKLLATVTTDSLGFYSFNYKYTGTKAQFTIVLTAATYNGISYSSQTQTVTLQSNKLVLVNFQIPQALLST